MDAYPDLHTAKETPSPIMEAASPRVEWRSSESPDWQHALRQVGGNPGTLDEVLQIFIDEWTRLRTSLHEAAQGSDWQQLKLAAHNAKSVFRLLRLNSAQDRALALERAAARQCAVTVPQLVPIVCGDVEQSANWCLKFLQQ